MRSTRTGPASTASPWRTAYREGQRAHPQLDVPFESFAPAGDAGDPPRMAADYYLARACEIGLPGAWERLQARFRRPLRAFLRRRGARSGEAEQLLDEAWGELASPPPRGGARTRVGTYDGRGSLRAWLSTVLWRRLADLWRARGAELGAEDEEVHVPGKRTDPALLVSSAEVTRLLGLSLEDAWSQLTPRELHAVVLKYCHHLPQTEIARVLRVGAPRVTRMLQSATARLRDAIVGRFDRHTDWEVGGAGWDGLLATVESMLARTAADLAPATQGRTADGRS